MTPSSKELIEMANTCEKKQGFNTTSLDTMEKEEK